MAASGSVDYVEDPVTRIVSITINISGLANFVVKTWDTALFYGIVKGSPEQSETWVRSGGLEDYYRPGGNYINSASSSARIKQNEDDPGKAVWVFSTNHESESGTGTAGVAILYSEDGGASWEKVYVISEEGNTEGTTFVRNWLCGPTGIVWDEDDRAFYASIYVADLYITYDEDEPERIDEIWNTEGEEILRSADGRSWSSVSRNMHLDSEAQSALDTTSDLNPYCKKPENRNYLGGSQKIPDGLQGYNKTTGIFIKPEALQGFEPWNGARYISALGTDQNLFLTTPNVTIVDDKGPVTTRSVNMPGCYAVGYFNNAWVAAGGNVMEDYIRDTLNTYIDVSFDDGQKWTPVFHSSDTWMAATVTGQSLVPSNEGPDVPSG